MKKWITFEQMQSILDRDIKTWDGFNIKTRLINDAIGQYTYPKGFV